MFNEYYNNRLFMLLSNSKMAFALAIALTASTLNADVISNIEAPDIREPAGTYSTANPNLLNMSATTVIGAGPCVTGNYAGCTLNDILNDVDSHDNFKPTINVHFSADDYPDDGRVTNASLRQRGNESRSAPQKSFRIKLDKNLPLWRGERKIQIMKSAFDPSRIRNKLSYDLFTTIPHLPSMRTQFVHFNLNDQGINHDYGLYTQIENFGKEYLKRRGWNKNSRVYKPEDFGYYEEDAMALDASGKPVNLAAFEQIVEIKRGKTHFDLINMIRDLNDPAIDFNTQIMGKYFNRDNYLTWFAINILFNNQDTHFHNYYLYNPKNSEKFYLVPWDYDSVLGMVPDEPEITAARLPRWWFSQANFWEIQLHKRFLSEPGNLQLLASAVTEIKNKYLTQAKIAQKRDAYYDIVFPVLRNTPDWNHLGLNVNSDPEMVAKYNQIFNKLSSQIDIQYARFMERLLDPMIFKMKTPVISSNYSNDQNIAFSWEESTSLTGQTITYDLDVATDREFKPGTVLEHITGISSLNHTLHWTHVKGTYYFRVIARDSAAPTQHWQESLNAPLTYPNTWVELHGVDVLSVPQDGDISNPPPPPPSGTVTNPVNSININGNASDWASTTAFATDPDDIPGGSSNVIDFQNATMAHNDQKLFIMIRNRGPIDPTSNSGSYTSWGWQVFLDTDNNPSTGFKLSATFGADYLLEATELQRYTGSGNNWNWQGFSSAQSRFNGNIEELSINRNLIGNPSSLRVVFQGANEAYGGSTLDRYPNSGNFGYSFGTTPPPPTNHAPVANNQSASVVINSRTGITLNASDADNDSLTVSIIQQPAHGVLVGSGLTVQYTPTQNYTGSDSFRYRVNDGTANSNIATVTLNVINDNSGSISNPVVRGGITVNGIRGDWNNLNLFAIDPDDVAGGNINTIDWLRAGMAHSSDTVYLMYENRGRINHSRNTGSSLSWGWQTYLDTDNNPATGFLTDNGIGADYMIEGNTVFRHGGSGWNWVNMGTASTRYNNNVAEMSFPRSWLGTLSNIKVLFFGNNEAFGGSSTDSYPNNGGFDYHFGNGVSGRITSVASNQSGTVRSPQNHQPPETNNHENPSNEIPSSGGGSLAWLFLFSTLVLSRRRLLLKR